MEADPGNTRTRRAYSSLAAILRKPSFQPSDFGLIGADFLGGVDRNIPALKSHLAVSDMNALVDQCAFALDLGVTTVEIGIA